MVYQLSKENRQQKEITQLKEWHTKKDETLQDMKQDLESLRYKLIMFKRYLLHKPKKTKYNLVDSDTISNVQRKITPFAFVTSRGRLSSILFKDQMSAFC